MRRTDWQSIDVESDAIKCHTTKPNVKTATKLNRLTVQLATAGITIPANPFDLIDIESHNTKRVEVLSQINDLLKKLHQLDDTLRFKISAVNNITTINPPALSARPSKGYINTLKEVTKILSEYPSGLTINQISEIAKKKAGLDMSYSRIYACVRSHKKFYRSSAIPFVWHVDNGSNV